MMAPLDLLGILEKVRDLQYSSTAEFFIDLNSIKINLHKIINFETGNNINFHLNGQINGPLGTSQTSPLLHSFDTIIDSCEMFLRARSVAIQLAQVMNISFYIYVNTFIFLYMIIMIIMRMMIII
jgi:hypothetical protein